jgi:hypothetical protein
LSIVIIQPNPDEPELKIEDSENVPILFFATKCTKMIYSVSKTWSFGPPARRARSEIMGSAKKIIQSVE